MKCNSNENDTPACFGTGCHPLALYYSSLLMQLKDILKEKRRGKVTNGVLFLQENSPCSPTTHLQPRRNWPTWAPNILITHPILRIWPRRTTTSSLD